MRSEIMLCAALAAVFATGPLAAQVILPLSDTEQAAPAMPPILPLRERAVVIDRLLRERLETVVPAIMREQGVDMWILAARSISRIR